MMDNHELSYIQLPVEPSPSYHDWLDGLITSIGGLRGDQPESASWQTDLLVEGLSDKAFPARLISPDSQTLIIELEPDAEGQAQRRLTYTVDQVVEQVGDQSRIIDDNNESLSYIHFASQVLTDVRLDAEPGAV